MTEADVQGEYEVFWNFCEKIEKTVKFDKNILRKV